MPVIVESPYVEQWIYSRLSGDSAITSSIVGTRIYRGVWVPHEDVVNLPCILFTELFSDDIQTLGAYRVFNELTYRIVAVDRSGGIQHLKPVADRIDTLFHKVSGSIAGATIMSSVRRQSVNMEAVGDIERNADKYQQLGGVYVIRAQAA